MSDTTAHAQTAEAEVADICRDLIRIDTSNYGDGSGPGERKAAEHIGTLFDEVGLDTTIYESEPGRASIFTRLEGTDPSAPALVVHGHTDVVPADKSEWSVDPFSAEDRDGLIWGRGAVDMKDMDAMIVANVREMIRNGIKPRRDIIIGFFADEEAGGVQGARWCIQNHPELFDGATEAISEVGGYSVDLRGRRTYLVQTAEKGIAWIKLIAKGSAGHGSQINDDNPVTRLAGAVARIGAHQWPKRLTPAVRELLEGVADITGLTFNADNTDELLAELGSVAKFVGATLQNTSNPTALHAGYKHNVIPGTAEALIDIRTLPGDDKHVLDTVRELAGDGVDLQMMVEDVALETEFSGSLVDTMTSSLLAEDPSARVLPYNLSGGTDNKSLSKLGITGYGFAPLQLTSDLDFPAMFHGVDERVPTSALEFGTRVLRRFMVDA
ncbi:M20/M25/M40 family metallo-hydrolase [Spelaeicoccus albus]|uniref:Acetylornithine deacetylase/succinyl-diaminopimelate desuccinylase-like protein n=1 Tax=Spelaeicoccus albus TaxID=1280376 RepID=A0A7Z0IIG5_9MICO|nr:M20/M25/M40 family metallo-hydrolase [Spelaeicoccus albus]NYI68434.1 acetylornithine deacetylase/succinyl-diaminopimelate desuccinylase-like protein [Spelaeicoccus albus]